MISDSSDSNELGFEVIRQAQLGNADSLAYLAEHAKDRLFVYIFRLTLDHHLAEDLAQETIVRMLQAIKRLKITNQQSFWAWLYRTALGRVQHHFRASGSKGNSTKVTFNSDQLAQCVDKSRSAALQQLIRKEMVGALAEAFTHLKLEHRNVLTLRCLDGLPYAQIATILGGTELRTRLLFLRAKQSLKRQLTRRGFRKMYLLSALSAFGILTASSSKTVTAAMKISASLANVTLGTTVLGAVTSKIGIAAASTVIAAGLVVGVSEGNKATAPASPQTKQKIVVPDRTMTKASASELIKAVDPDWDGWKASSIKWPKMPVIAIEQIHAILKQQWRDQYLLILPENHSVELGFSGVIQDIPGADIIITGRIFDTAPQVFATDGAGKERMLTETGRKKLEQGNQVAIGYDISTANLTFQPRAVRIVGTSNTGPRGGFEFGGVTAITR
jgi:RNA polymerase sigma factor (sigma-70 family)